MLPVLAEQPIDRTWPKSLLSVGPSYVIGAAIAVGLAETMDRRAWEVFAVVGVPLLLLYRAYYNDLSRSADDARRHEVIESLGEGMCVVDTLGQVILWNDALEAIVECPRARALGSPLVHAVPALANTDVQRVFDEVSATRSARTVVVSLPSAAGLRILDVKVLPADGGVTLLWHDATARAHAERALKRGRRAARAGGRGRERRLWEWDLRTQELYVSGRWRAMLGSPAAGGHRAAAGMVRSCPPGGHRVRSKRRIEAHLAGKTDYLHHEHRLRHEDGSYRRFLCRGIAARRQRPAVRSASRAR